MIKSLTPPTQTFKELPSAAFFTEAGCSTRLYQKILPFSYLGGEVFNAIVMEEIPSGQRGHRYNMKLIGIVDDYIVTRVEVVDIEIAVAPKSVNV